MSWGQKFRVMAGAALPDRGTGIPYHPLRRRRTPANGWNRMRPEWLPWSIFAVRYPRQDPCNLAGAPVLFANQGRKIRHKCPQMGMSAGSVVPFCSVFRCVSAGGRCKTMRERIPFRADATQRHRSDPPPSVVLGRTFVSTSRQCDVSRTLRQRFDRAITPGFSEVLISLHYLDRPLSAERRGVRQL